MLFRTSLRTRGCKWVRPFTSTARDQMKGRGACTRGATSPHGSASPGAAPYPLPCRHVVPRAGSRSRCWGHASATKCQGLSSRISSREKRAAQPSGKPWDPTTWLNRPARAKNAARLRVRGSASRSASRTRSLPKGTHTCPRGHIHAHGDTYMHTAHTQVP